jgi:hypothetical protein
MQLKYAAALSGLAVSVTRAFVIVPEISEADTDIVNSLPFEEPLSGERLLVNLDCPGCPVDVRTPTGEVGTATDMPSHLELLFTIDHTADHDTLLLNGFQLYPLEATNQPPLTAALVLDVPEAAMRHARQTKKNLKTLAFGMDMFPTVTDSEDQQLELVERKLTIMVVDDTWVDDIPSVDIRLVKLGDHLTIGSIEVAEPDTMPPSPTDEEKKCSTMLCKWKALISGQMAKMRGKPCMSKGPKPPHHGMDGRPGHHRGQHGGHHDGHHGHHGHQQPNSDEEAFRHHHKHHSWHMLFRNVVAHILLPVLIGISAGVSISILGMIIGHAFFRLYRLATGRPAARQCRHHRRSHSHKATIKETAVEEEKSGLMEHQDPPPRYEQENDASDRV